MSYTDDIPDIIPPVPSHNKVCIFFAHSVCTYLMMPVIKTASHDTPISPLPPFQHLRSIPAPLSVDRRFSYPQVSSLSISESNYSRRVSTPEHEPSYGSEPVSVSIGSNEEGDGRKNKKARAQSMDTDNVPKRVSRKTAVACNFCRGVLSILSIDHGGDSIFNDNNIDRPEASMRWREACMQQL